jgi:hypothetical protein
MLHVTIKISHNQRCAGKTGPGVPSVNRTKESSTIGMPAEMINPPKTRNPRSKKERAEVPIGGHNSSNESGSENEKNTLSRKANTRLRRPPWPVTAQPRTTKNARQN